VIRKEFQVDGSPDMEIRIESGRVELRTGPEERVGVTVDTKMPGFIVEQRGNSILVSSDKETPWLSRGSAYVVVEAPPESDLTVAVASAPIRADLPLGKVDLKSASGDIELDTVESVAIKTASGDAEIASVAKSLTFTSASGNLRVRDGCHGDVAVSSASGDVLIKECTGSISVNTASGDSRLERFTGRNASFKSMSGDVDLGIPGGTDVSLDVRLLSGKLRLPDPEPRKGAPERQMSIRAKMVSGDLTITRV
jgi:DUF4097 and DUF4098 domain-containing protein YvlB